MNITWDPAKDATNWVKHGVDFSEAASVLEDPLSTTWPDPDHSRGEQRFITLGLSPTGRVLLVAHTDLGWTIRIISARAATRQERRQYEEGA